MFEKSLEEELEAKKNAPVECLGMTFPNDEERRKYFLEKLREKLKDPDFRKIEGFPIGSDEDILALSDPPYYTACPNPFISAFIKHYGKSYDPSYPYSREPFAVDVSEGKNDPIYNAHAYHTKVPHRAILRYLIRYTNPGDLVLDFFAGTGMTGVATQLCENPSFKIRETVMSEEPDVQWGSRYSLLIELSPIAGKIAAGFTRPFNSTGFRKEAEHLLNELEAEFGWMYETDHSGWPAGIRRGRQRHNTEREGTKRGRINFVVWADVFNCSECTQEFDFWSAAVDEGEGAARETFPCPHCSALLTRRSVNRAYEIHFDPYLNTAIRRSKQMPVRWFNGNGHYAKSSNLRGEVSDERETGTGEVHE
ncbi:MAG: hypothetical protein C4576_34890, partial [Desulfobacteraceae bacterium]